MKNILYMIIIALTFTACTPSSLDIASTKEISIKIDSQPYLFSKDIKSAKRLGFQKMDIYQYSALSSDGGLLFCENVTMDLEYEFMYGSITTLKYIFDVIKTNIIYSSGSTLLIQLRLVTGDYINLLADKSGFQEMQYVYGFSNQELLSIASNLKAENYELKEAVRLKGSITEWTQTKLILQPLIKPMFNRRSPF